MLAVLVIEGFWRISVLSGKDVSDFLGEMFGETEDIDRFVAVWRTEGAEDRRTVIFTICFETDWYRVLVLFVFAVLYLVHCFIIADYQKWLCIIRHY